MKLMHDIGLSDVVRIMSEKGYTVWDSAYPNIVGIRNSSREAKDFDDICWVWWRENGKQVVHNYTITTNPGLHYLQHPIAGTSGTAILVPGQYRNCWILAMHRGKQFALCQRNGEVKVYRDDNKDTVLDYRPETITEGYFGIDLHNAGLNNPETVGPWSAGCQVWRYHEAHEELMQDFKRLGEDYNFSRFTYSLLNQEDFV